MFGYYLELALRSLKRNKVLTMLMVLALGLGIGACITTFTVLKLLSGDPLPQKSAHLFYPQLDPYPKEGYVPGVSKPAPTMTYIDGMNLMQAYRANRQALVATAPAKISPLHAGSRPFFGDAVMTTSDFFPMFGAPFEYGGSWTASDDEKSTKIVVIASYINDKLFGGGNSVGRTLRVDEHDYRIIGVLKPWSPQPRFYSIFLSGRNYGQGDAVFLPLRAARSDGVTPGGTSCYEVSDINKLETAPCTWLGLWVELSDSSAAQKYRVFLASYAQQQMALGRFHRPDVSLFDLMGWLRDIEIVPDDVRLHASLAIGFLIICIVNTVGLLLAKCLRRSQEIGVRRALGANRFAIFAQFMVEAGMVGMAGGVLGLAFAELGLWGIRHQPAEYASLAQLDPTMFALTFIVALTASLIAGILPAWRASALAPSPQLKSA